MLLAVHFGLNMTIQFLVLYCCSVVTAVESFLSWPAVKNPQSIFREVALNISHIAIIMMHTLGTYIHPGTGIGHQMIFGNEAIHFAVFGCSFICIICR